jgi:hypothetical protein
MFGQGAFVPEPVWGAVFCDGVAGAGAVLVEGVDVVGVVGVGVVLVELVVAAEAPAMPAAAPPVASAPATIVAWSILDIRIGSNLLDGWVMLIPILRSHANCEAVECVGVV